MDQLADQERELSLSAAGQVTPSALQERASSRHAPLNGNAATFSGRGVVFGRQQCRPDMES